MLARRRVAVHHGGGALSSPIDIVCDDVLWFHLYVFCNNATSLHYDSAKEEVIAATVSLLYYVANQTLLQ